MLSVTINSIMQSIIMLSAVKLNVIILSVIMVNVVAVEWHLLEAIFARMTFMRSIGNLSWINLTFGQGSPSLIPFSIT